LEEEKENELKSIRDSMFEAYPKENISEIHYSLLKEKLSNYEKTIVLNLIIIILDKIILVYTFLESDLISKGFY